MKMLIQKNNIPSNRLPGWHVVVLLLISFCVIVLPRPTLADDEILIAVSILPQVEFAKQIAGQINIQTMVMIPPGANPSTYELTPGQMKKLNRVKVYFKVGTKFPFEQVWLLKIIDLNPDMLIVDCSKGIITMSGEEEHSSGKSHHTHGQDPHIWCSPVNARIMVDNMVEGFIAVDPKHKSEYKKNAKTYKRQLDEINSEIIKLFQSKTNRKFIIFHPAWGYFAREYNLIQMPIEIEGKEPGVSDLRKLINMAKHEGLNTVFASPQFNAESAKIIAAEIGGSVVFIDPLRKDYLSNLSEVALKLSQAMH